MGEAKRRREAEAAGKPAPAYSLKVPKVRELNAVMVDKLAFDTEYAEVVKQNPRYGPVMFAEALIESGLEHMRQAREAREERERTKDNLILPATHLPPGIAEAARRLEAIKRGAA